MQSGERVAREIVLREDERAALAKLAASRLTSVSLSQRAHIVLLAAEGLQNRQIAVELGIGRIQVARWRGRYAQSRLAGIERDLPRGAPPKQVDLAQLVDLTTQPPPEVVCDNDATHRHPKVREWLAKHPRFHVHFTPTSASWLNRVERFFHSISTDRLERGVFRSLPELITAIDEYIAVHQQNPQPFIWTAKANDILQKVMRANRRLGSKKNEALH